MAWDRATIVHPRSLEILESLGVVEPVVEAGVHIRAARLHSGGEVLAQLDFARNGSRYGFDVGLSEEMTERVLTGYLHSTGGSVTRSTRLLGFEQHDTHVVAEIEHDGERRSLTAGWLVGCDGFHSTVRTAAGIDYDGSDAEEPWAVFDAGLGNWDGEFDVTLAHFDDPLVILTPLPGRRFRVYLRPHPGVTDFERAAREILQTYAPGVTFTGVENPTPFRCHARVARHFRSGRVLLAGDAAHSCSPTEGHGMNTGLQDAYNLGWKLADVCQGEAGDALLDSYESERRPVAEMIVASGLEADAAQALVEAEERAARDAGIRAAFADPDSLHHEAVAAAEIDRDYAASEVIFESGVGTSATAPRAGRLLPDTAPVRTPDGEVASLHELAHRAGHTVFVIGGPAAARERVETLLAEARAAAGPGGTDSVFAFATGEGSEGIGSIDAATAEQLGAEDIVLLAVRPDRYIGLRDDGADAAALAGYLRALAA